MTNMTPSIVIDKLGTHLLQVTNNHTGEVKLKWHWETLEHEVKAAMLAYESKQEKKAAKKDIVKETEKKVTKSRAKKAEAPVVKETKKPAAKKPAAKKAVTKKSK
jgi:hypothetical protein